MRSFLPMMWCVLSMPGLCESEREVIICGRIGPTNKYIFDSFLTETDPAGFQFNFKVRTNESWTLSTSINTFRSFQQFVDNTNVSDFLTKAIQFHPSRSNQPRKCVPVNQSTFCILVLAYELDAEEIYRRCNRQCQPVSRYAFSFQISCAKNNQLFQKTLAFNVDVRNEFAPTFSRPTITKRFRPEKLTPGAVIFDLKAEKPALDRDVGIDGQIIYSLANGSRMAHIQHSKVILTRGFNLTRDLDSERSVRFLLTATDNGDPKKNAPGSGMLILRVLDPVDNNTDDKNNNNGDDKNNNNGDDKNNNNNDDDDLATPQGQNGILAYALSVSAGVILFIAAAVFAGWYFRKRVQATSTTRPEPGQPPAGTGTSAPRAQGEPQFASPFGADDASLEERLSDAHLSDTLSTSEGWDASETTE